MDASFDIIMETRARNVRIMMEEMMAPPRGVCRIVMSMLGMGGERKTIRECSGSVVLGLGDNSLLEPRLVTVEHSLQPTSQLGCCGLYACWRDDHRSRLENCTVKQTR